MAPSENQRKVKIGLLGSGTVGEAIQDFFFSGDVNRQIGDDIGLEIVKIYTPHPKKKKWYPSHTSVFTTKPFEVIEHPEVEIIVEVLGCLEEEHLSTFRDYIIRAFRQGKAVVTSDKAVLARFGKEIWDAAEQYRRELRFEASVGGGIPVIRSLTDGFAVEEPEAIYGIINGTCNYILSEMGKSGKSYEEALREAQLLGYAETNAKSDTTGVDAEAKLILLAAVTFGLHVKPGELCRKGIEEVQAIDFLYADKKGHATIKYLAIAANEGGAIQAYVSPVLVPQEHFLSAIDGPTNAIFFKGRRSGEQNDGSQKQSRDWNYVFVGPGAGGNSTAVAVLGDVVELARKRLHTPAGPRSLVRPGVLSLQLGDHIGARFYVRFVVKDRAGIVGDICQTLGKAGINISEVWQLGHGRDELQGLVQKHRLQRDHQEILPFVITLERTTTGQLKNALGVISRKDYILVEPFALPIWSVK
ncbi:MAG: homoserine dehydrogenase [Candidatus Binatia bacterium]